MSIEIVSWNVNSVNARMQNIQRFIKEQNPSIMLFQEIKCIHDRFPKEAFEDIGYNVAIFGQKAYNGVAILSKNIIDDVFIDILNDGEARYIEASTYINKKCIKVASVYVPNGTAVGSERFKYKLHFLEQLNKRIYMLNKNKEIFVIGGDFNVAPDIWDVYDPKNLSRGLGFHIEERDRFRSIINENGAIDAWRLFNPLVNDMYSWWDYRTNGIKKNEGMRIDNLLVSPIAIDNIDSVKIYKNIRTWEKPSDHVPVSIIFKTSIIDV